MAGVSLVMDGKVVLITGGSRGIGAETVRLFTEAGARVAFSYRQAREQAEVLVAECGGAQRCIALEQDLSSPEDGRALVAAAVSALGRLDALVVNHGIWPPNDAPIAQMTDAQWRRTMAVNLDSVFGLVQATVSQLELQGRPENLKKGGGGVIYRPVHMTISSLCTINVQVNCPPRGFALTVWHRAESRLRCRRGHWTTLNWDQ